MGHLQRFFLLADGYFVLPYTIQNYLSDQIQVPRFSTDLPEFVQAEKEVQAKIDKLMAIKGTRSVDSIHKELGVTGCRVMGGGFGGCTINLVKNELYDAFVAAAKEKFTAQFGHAPLVYDVVIGDGSHKLD